LLDADAMLGWAASMTWKGMVIRRRPEIT
jgi:hypothetical protein